MDKPRLDGGRVPSGIISINRNGLRWRGAPAEYGPHMTLYNRWKRWSYKGIFARMMAGMAKRSENEDADSTEKSMLAKSPPRSPDILKR